MSVVINPVTQKILGSVKNDSPQSLLLTGQSGVGLRTIATWLAENQLAGIVRPRNAKDQADSESGVITVEMIRELYSQTRAKYTSRQVIIIDDADRMSLGGQSAFLKLLEEPNSHIYFILTSHTPQNLLPTIRSRVQHTYIQPLTQVQSDNLIALLGVTDATKRSQLQFIANGLPAELTRLITNEPYFKECAEIIGDARDFLQADTYKKLGIIHKYRSSRTQALQLIDSALQILRRSTSVKPQQRLVLQLEQLLTIRERIEANHNIPLQLTQFVV